MKKKVLFMVLVLLASKMQPLFSQYTGTFTLNTGEAKLTLNIKESEDGVITGTLQSTTGVYYTLQGQMEEGVALGVCSNEQSAVYFEAYLEGNQLTMGLIEPDEFSMPDYDNAQYLSFTRQETGDKTDQPDSEARMKPEPVAQGGALMQHFAGQWTHFTSYTTNTMYLYPGGIYSDHYEASYSGGLTGGGNWMAHGQDADDGNWTVQGNKDQGQIIINLNNGEQIILEYQVHREDGQTYYSEYWFNGSLYLKSAIE